MVFSVCLALVTVWQGVWKSETKARERELPRSCEMRKQWLRDGEKGTGYRDI